jgi:hypothetical protein
MSSEQRPEDPTAGVIKLLQQYRERREEFHRFDEYDAVMDTLRATTAAKIDKINEPLKSVATRLFTVTDKGFFLLAVCEWKIDAIADALIQTISANNSIALANNTRALIEHLGAFVAVAKELDSLALALKGQNTAQGINHLLDKTERFLHRGYYGKSPKVTKDKNEQALHVESDCLAALKEEITDIYEVYDFLCEYVHPNYGSNALVSTGVLGAGRLNPPADFHRDTINRLLRYCALAMIFLKERGIVFAGVILRLQGLLDLCFVSQATIGNVFAKKAAKPRGDGTSKETAYFFPNARTKLEAMQLCYDFLANQGLQIQNRHIGTIDGTSIYDVFVTDDGSIWFKLPLS